jgi:glycosidase
LKDVLQAWRARGFRIVLDGVFHHCGRNFAPFQDVVRLGQASAYKHWFAGLNFSGRSPYGDGFSYQGWNGHLSLVKFNLAERQVRDHLFSAVAHWMDTYGIDGLRLDAADVMDKSFLRELAAFCRARKPGFWLLGEVIHGDYRAWAPGAGLDAVTNYEAYKGLWSSHNDANYHEIAHTLNRQFGPQGLYRGTALYNFADNHDVERVASILKEPAHLYPLTMLLFTMPGIPSVYYGSEAGLPGKKAKHSDAPLRPALLPEQLATLPQARLRTLISVLAAIRQARAGLRAGEYREGMVAARQFAFWRVPAAPAEPVLTCVNAAAEPVSVKIPVPADLGAATKATWVDLLDPTCRNAARAGILEITCRPRWGRILCPQQNVQRSTLEVGR